MEKLRQALKTLSEAEKQLRVSNDRMTWLTAALLQLAPDQQYMLPSSSADTSFNQSPLVLNNAPSREKPRKSNAERPAFRAGISGHVHDDAKLKGTGTGGNEHDGGRVVPRQAYIGSNVKNQINKPQLSGIFHDEIEEIWLQVLEKIPINSIKEFMYQEAKLISVSYGAGTFIF